MRGRDADSDGPISSGYKTQGSEPSSESAYSWLPTPDDGETWTPVPEESSSEREYELEFSDPFAVDDESIVMFNLWGKNDDVG